MTVFSPLPMGKPPLQPAWVLEKRRPTAAELRQKHLDDGGQEAFGTPATPQETDDTFWMEP